MCPAEEIDEVCAFIGKRISGRNEGEFSKGSAGPQADFRACAGRAALEKRYGADSRMLCLFEVRRICPHLGFFRLPGAAAR